MQTNPIASLDPVLKIGAVVLRADTRAVLILQPIPKHAGEVPPFVLPRGSRQYQLADGSWHDARDTKTGRTHIATLEPYRRGLEREIEEEAGISPGQLATANIVEIGSLPFQSRTKENYPIWWYRVTIDAALADMLVQQVPVDALSIRWATLNEIKQMAAEGHFSAGYIPVIEQALTRADGAV